MKLIDECKKHFEKYKVYESDERSKTNYEHDAHRFKQTIRYFYDSQLMLETDSYVSSSLHSLNDDFLQHADTDTFRKVFAFAMKGDINEALANDIHPSTAGMVNMQNISVNNTRYIARNLPKDDYELIDTYRNTGGETCEHCGKEHIVNVMVIRNPKGEIFHVGNECVYRLVDIPKEEFDAWNQPFTDAFNAINLYNKNKKNGIYQYWFIYGDNAYFMYCDRPFEEYDFLNTDKVYEHRNKDAIKGKFKIKEYAGIHNITGGEDINYTGAEFLKRMLPVYYKKAVVINHNIMDIVDTVTKSKTENGDIVTYDGFRYDIRELWMKISKLVPYGYDLGTTYSYEHDNMKIEITTMPEDRSKPPEMKITFGKCEAIITYTCDDFEGMRNPFMK
jgi:hypothetical protein